MDDMDSFFLIRRLFARRLEVAPGLERATTVTENRVTNVAEKLDLVVYLEAR